MLKATVVDFFFLISNAKRVLKSAVENFAKEFWEGGMKISRDE